MPKKKSARDGTKRGKKPSPPARTSKGYPGLQFDVTTIRIVESEAKLNIAGNEIPTHAYTTARPSLGAVKNEKIILGNVRFSITTNKPDEPLDTSKSYVRLAFQVQCVFAGDSLPEADDLSDEQAAWMLNTTMLMAWPYARQFANSMTFAMGIPPVTMPIYRPWLNPQKAHRSADGKHPAD